MVVAASSSQSRSAPAFDPSVIDGFRGIMSPEAVRELVADMERDVGSRIARLARAKVGPSGLAGIAQDAHDLRSLGGNFGLVELAERAGTVERAARGGSVETVAEHLPGLLAAGRASLQALKDRSEKPGTCAK